MNTNPTKSEEQFELGRKYFKGDGLPRNLEKAVYWYTKSAEQKHAEAQCHLADSYFLGEGVQKDFEKANFWYTKAAKQGSVNAQYCIGANYFLGVGVPLDRKKAFYWFKKAAEQGNESAQYNIGSAYFFGDGVQKNFKKAQSWLTKFIEQKVERIDIAYYIIGQTFDLGGYGIKKKPEKAVEWYKKAANLGNKNSKIRLGEIYLFGAEGVPIDVKEAEYWRTKAN